MSESDARHGAGSSSARWAALLLRFNLQPALYADASWLPRWARRPETLQPCVRDALSRAMLHDRGLGGLHDWTLENRAGRFFLMDSRSRDAVALALGVAAQRDPLRRVVLKARLDALRGALGDALGTLWMPVAEAVEPAQRPVSIAWEAFDGKALGRALTMDGYSQLLRLVDRENHALWGRAVLCAPRGVASTEPLPAMGAAPAKRLIGGVISELIPRRTAQWAWLF